MTYFTFRDSGHTRHGFAVARSLVAGGLLVGLLCSTGMLFAADEALPKAEGILDKYVEVTGGKAAYEKLHNRVMKGKFEVPSMGIKGTIAVYNAEPVKSYSVVEAPSLGKMEEGTNGEVAWESSAMTGPRIKQGAERAVALRGAQFDGTVNWRKLFKKVECVGMETVEGQPCYKIELTPVDGDPETQYFDKKSNLLVRSDMILDHAMGKIPIESYTSDYRAVDGVRIPHIMRQVVVGHEQRITIETIAHNVTIPAERFDLPAEIKALVSKEQKKAD